MSINSLIKLSIDKALNRTPSQSPLSDGFDKATDGTFSIGFTDYIIIAGVLFASYKFLKLYKNW